MSNELGTYPPTARKGGILGRMSHVYDMYCMVKAVDLEIRRLDKQEPQQVRENDYSVWLPPTSNVKSMYIEKHKKATVSHAQYVLNCCVDRKNPYLSIGKPTAERTGFDSVKIEEPGWKLIEKTFGFIPTGLLYAWYKESGWVFLTIIGLLVGILASLIKIATSDQGISINLFQTTNQSQVQSQAQVHTKQ